MSRKIILTLLISALLFGGITTYVSAQQPTKLKFWNYWQGANAETLDKLISQFNEQHPDIQVESVFIPGGDLLTKLQSAIAADNTPALAISDLIGMPKLIESGELVPLDSYIESSGLNLKDFYDSLLVYGRNEGKVYSFPVSTNNLELYWNKELFKKAGLNPNQPPKTWDELVQFGKQIKEKTGKWGLELYTEGGEGTTWQWQVYLWQAGGDFLTHPNYKKPAFDSPAGVQALQFWDDLVNKHKISPLASWGLFGRGEAAMVMDGSWMVQFFPRQVDFELGTAPMPIPEGGQQATNMGGEQIFIFANSPEKQEAAWTFVKWFTSTQTQIEWDMGTGFTPVRESVATNDKYTAWVNNAKPLLLPFVKEQKNAHARPPITEYTKVSDIVSEYIIKALHNKVSPSEALDKAAKEVEKEIRG